MKKCLYSYIYLTGEEVDQKVINQGEPRRVVIKQEDLRSISRMSGNSYKSWKLTAGDHWEKLIGT